MFTRDRDTLLEAITRMQKKACGYNSTPCDCKYGASGAGEQTGCPELRNVILLLQNMTDGQYDFIVGGAEGKPRVQNEQKDELLKIMLSDNEYAKLTGCTKEGQPIPTTAK